MKNLIYIFSLLFPILFVNCSGSDVYRGEWKATDMNNNKFTIHFEENTLTITKEDGESKSYKYTQNSVKIENSTSRYGLNLEGGIELEIVFPTKDKDKGIINTPGSEQPLYIISRTDYIQYSDFGLI